MPATIYYEADADLGRLTGRTVAIMGYGSQGHAHALNLRDSGVNVVVGLRDGSSSIAKAEAEGLPVLSISEAAGQADIMMMALPDTEQAAIYTEQIAPNLATGNAIAFSHGFKAFPRPPGRNPDIDNFRPSEAPMPSPPRVPRCRTFPKPWKRSTGRWRVWRIS